jgi:hypothetical protein
MGALLNNIQASKERLRKSNPWLPAGSAGYYCKNIWDYIDLKEAVEEFYYPAIEMIVDQFWGYDDDYVDGE